MFAGAQQQQGGDGMFDRLGAHMQNPLVAAALGAGGGMLQASQQGGGLADALRSGIGGGIGTGLGQSQMNQQKMKDEERDRLLHQIIARLVGVADRQGGYGQNPNDILGQMFNGGG